MARPKGSKNKPKEKIITNGGISTPEAFKAPDLEKEADAILANPEVVVTSTGCKNCGHPINTHYGPKDRPTLDWCNNSGCKCLTFEK